MKEVLFLADANSRVNQQIALGLAERLQAEGRWIVRIAPCRQAITVMKSLIRAMRPNALVIHTKLSSRQKLYVKGLDIPRVLVGVDHHPEMPLPVVIPDDEAIGHLAAKHLLGLGFDHFAALYFSGVAPAPRIEVFRRNIQRAGKTFQIFLLPISRIVDQPFRAISSHSDLLHWLRRLPKPCAILAHSDNPGARLIEICVQHGLRVPEDLAVLGVDDDPLFCRTISPNLASIRVPNARIGMEAARLILEWPPGRSGTRQVLKIPPTGVAERESIRGGTTTDPLVAKALAHLQENTGKIVRVRDLQKLTGLTPQMLVYRFRNAIQHTPMEEILRQRINYAKHLLAETTEPVVTIVGRCGFNNANRFYLVFRNLTNMSPVDYREKFTH